MDSKLRNAGTTWLGLTLMALTMVGVMAHSHPRQAAAMPAAMEVLAKDVVLQPVMDSSAGAPPSSARDDAHRRRPALSMPYFSFARLLRPGS